MPKFVDVFRWVYALYYLVCSVGVCLLLLGVVTIGVDIDFGVGINQLLQFMLDTGFMMVLLASAYFGGSVLLMIRRTVPLGLVLLAPAVVVILFTHWCVEGGSPAWGTGNALILLAFAWQCRGAYFPLFNFSDKKPL